MPARAKIADRCIPLAVSSMSFSFRRLALLPFVLCLPCCASWADTTEGEPLMDSAAIVQPALLSGPGFTVSSQTQLHGYMARFEIENVYGPLRADSVEL